MNLEEMEKGLEVAENAMNMICQEQRMSSGGCSECAFYNAYAEMPCEICRFGFPLVKELKRYIYESKECLV